MVENTIISLAGAHNKITWCLIQGNIMLEYAREPYGGEVEKHLVESMGKIYDREMLLMFSGHLNINVRDASPVKCIVS